MTADCLRAGLDVYCEKEMSNTIDRIVGTVSAMRTLATSLTISAGTYKKLVNMGGAGSGWVGETDARPETATPTLRELVFNTAEIYANPATTFVASFIGAPPMNLIPGEVTDQGLALGGHVLPYQTSHRGSVTFGLRPERARLNGQDTGMPLEVQVVEELGAQRLIHGRLGAHDLTIAQSAEEPVPSGRMGLSFAIEDAFLFNDKTGQRI